MLADPWGNRLHSAYKPGTYTGHGHGGSEPRVRFLVEVCDPCESEDYSYEIDGYPMSDFVTPHYYRSTMRGIQCSFTGAVHLPRSVLGGGYVSYVDEDGQWWQQTYFGYAPETQKLEGMGTSRLSTAHSLRARVDELVREARAADDRRRSALPRLDRIRRSRAR
jgi:hypothetical protein